MLCICNEKHIFKRNEYFLPSNYSMNYKRYSYETYTVINIILKEIIHSIEEKEKIIIHDNYFEYQEKEIQEDYVSTGYFNMFLSLGNYLNTLS
jgi:hypothetical protein